MSDNRKKYKIDPATLISSWSEREEHIRKLASKHKRREQ